MQQAIQQNTKPNRVKKHSEPRTPDKQQAVPPTAFVRVTTLFLQHGQVSMAGSRPRWDDDTITLTDFVVTRSSSSSALYGGGYFLGIRLCSFDQGLC